MINHYFCVINQKIYSMNNEILLYGWWFTLYYMASNTITLICFPGPYKQHILWPKDVRYRMSQFFARLGSLCLYLVVAYSMFCPIKWEGDLFYIGLVIGVIGLLAYITSLINYASSSHDKPTTKGMYRYSRNPQQVFSIMYWVGAGLMMQSVVVIIGCILQVVFSYRSFLLQERFKVEKYGDDYVEYMSHTPRYLGLPK